MAKQEATPDIEIRILLDGQEYVSESYNNTQRTSKSSLSQNAGDSESKRKVSSTSDFLYSYELSQSGLDLRFKYYAFRWDYSYAKQMHHKYMVIDDEIVATGSYNLSDNAEHNTFENVTILAQIPMGNCRRLRRQLRFHVESRERGVRRLYERASHPGCDTTRL